MVTSRMVWFGDHNISGEAPVITTAGAVTSATVTSWVAVEVFPDPSVTVQVTVVLPSGNTAGASLVTEATEQLSAVTGVPRLTPDAEQVLSAETVTAFGAVIVGFSSSTTVIVVLQVLLAPFESVTVNITFVVPSE